MVFLIQVIAGNPLIGYANYFFEQAGLNPAEAFDSKERANSHDLWMAANEEQWALETLHWVSLVLFCHGFC
jgi:hypothetical protein